MTDHFNRDPHRDPELEALLRDAGGPQPEVDWSALHGRITSAAELSLAGRRRDQRRRPLTPLLRTLLPLAAAAGIAGGYLTLKPETTATDPVIDQMVEASLPESVDQLITGEAAQGALLEAVAGS
jgi:hypothetical protein